MGHGTASKTEMIKRALPKNIADKDIELFEHELLIQVNQPVFVIKKWFAYNNKNEDYFPISLKTTLFRHNWRSKLKIFDRAIWITDRWSGNYFHWLTEVGQKLELIKKSELEKVPILIPNSLAQLPFIREFVAHFSNYNFRVLKGYETIVIRSLSIPQLNIKTGNYHAELIRKFYQPEERSSNELKIFIKRNTKDRSLTNYAELEPLLLEKGFQVVDTGNMSLNEQMHLFANTNVLVAVHGAGLTNMLFMKHGSMVLELRKKGDGQNNCYFSLASALGLNYYYQLCDTDNPEALTQHSNFHVDIEKLRKNIELLVTDV